MALLSFFFFFNDTATTEIYTLSLHDALPISSDAASRKPPNVSPDSMLSATARVSSSRFSFRDRKSTRLNSSHSQISYAVFCLKKKKSATVLVWMHSEGHVSRARDASPRVRSF